MTVPAVGSNAARATIEQALYTAIRTLAALPDRERRYIYAKQTSWPETLRDEAEVFANAVEAGRHEDMEEPRRRPTPTEIDAMLPNLALLVRLAERQRKVIWARAFDVPWWKLASKFRRSERTIRRWHDDGLEAACRAVS